MFLSGQRGVTRDGQQRAQGRFLIVFCDHNLRIALDNGGTAWRLYACVRSVRLSQCGHFMMGSTRIGGTTITLSGTYGADGLPIDLDKLLLDDRKHLVAVPDALARIFWVGGGHNTPGREALSMLRWALS